jgi:hypothetical protein
MPSLTYTGKGMQQQQLSLFEQQRRDATTVEHLRGCIRNACSYLQRNPGSSHTNRLIRDQLNADLAKLNQLKRAHG